MGLSFEERFGNVARFTDYAIVRRLVGIRSRRRQAPGVATPARGPSARLRVRSGEPDPIPFILHSLPRAAPAA